MLCSSCPSGCDLSVSATVSVADPAAKVVSVPTDDVTGAGVVAAGAVSLSFFNYGPAAITVNGKTLSVRASISYPFLGQGITYPAIPYDATGSTLRIDRTVLP
jgi:hypothetical protein